MLAIMMTIRPMISTKTCLVAIVSESSGLSVFHESTS